MQQELNRKQSVVYFSDIVGYTRLMGKDEDAAFELMKQNLEIHKKVLSEYRGKIIKELGDGILAVFENAADALHAGLEIQKACKSLGKYEIRIGLQSGEIIFDHGDVFGDAVNVASRIQSVGIPSSIVFSDRVCKEILKNENLQTTKLGGFNLKNVANTLELYALTNPPLSVPKRAEILNNIKSQEHTNLRFWVGISAVFLVLLALIYSVFWNGYVWEKEKSVAVLPFVNLSKNPELDYFTDGLTENLISQISKINSIKTISFQTMAAYRNSDTPVDSLADALSVTTVLKGTVEKLNPGYRFKLQLIDAKENKNIWTDEYTREGTDLTHLQNEIAKEIAKILDVRLTSEEAVQIGKGETSNAEAYDLLFKAKRLYYEGFSNPDLFKEAVTLLKKAIEIDPNYALAYTWLAKSYYQIGFDDPDGIWNDLSLEMSSKALELEPKLAEGYSARGMVYYEQGQFTKAKNSLETALSFYPNLSDAIGNLATIQFTQGNLAEALRLQKKSSDLNPNSYLPYQNIGWIYKILGKNEEALRWFERSLEVNKNPTTYELMANLLISEGRKEEALKLLEFVPTSDSISGNVKAAGSMLYYSGELDSAFHVFNISMQKNGGEKFWIYDNYPIPYSYMLKKKGEHRLADSLLNEIIKVKTEAISLGYEDYYLPLELATAYAVKNSPNESLKYLEIAYERGWRDYFFTEFNPAFNNLRNDNRYLKIHSKIKAELNAINQALSSTSLQRDK
jgi:adenylate cyclase